MNGFLKNALADNPDGFNFIPSRTTFYVRIHQGTLFIALDKLQFINLHPATQNALYTHLKNVYQLYAARQRNGRSFNVLPHRRLLIYCFGAYSPIYNSHGGFLETWQKATSKFQVTLSSAHAAAGSNTRNQHSNWYTLFETTGSPELPSQVGTAAKAIIDKLAAYRNHNT